jgi:hypothetical protein
MSAAVVWPPEPADGFGSGDVPASHLITYSKRGGRSPGGIVLQLFGRRREITCGRTRQTARSHGPHV